MILTRKRLDGILRDVPDKNLQELIRTCIAIRSSHGPKLSVPQRDYRNAVQAMAEREGMPNHAPLEVLNEKTLRDQHRPDSGPQDLGAWESVVQLDRIELENFGSYFGTQGLDIAPNGSKNVTVFVGGNGGGKSTVFQAINWALFGAGYLDEELVGSANNQLNDRQDLVNHRAVRDLRESNRSVTTAVGLWFSVSDKKYIIRRRFDTTMLADAPSASIVSSRLVSVDAEGNHVDMPEDSLAELLSGIPKKVKDFYLFDGENINNFTLEESTSDIRAAIRRVVGLELLEEVVEGIGELDKKLRQEHKRVASNGVAAAMAAEEQQRSLVENQASELEETSKEIASLGAMIEKLREKLRESPDTGEIQKRRELFERQLAEAKLAQQDAAKRMRQRATASFLSLATPAVAAARDELDKLRTRGELPGAISEQLLLDLLSHNECVCGTDLTAGSSARRAIEMRLAREAKSGPYKDRLLDLFYDLKGTLKDFDTYDDELERSEYEFAQWSEKKREIEVALSGIAKELEGISLPDSRDAWESERKGLETERERAMFRQAELRHRIVESKKTLAELSAKVTKLAANEKSADSLLNQHLWAQAAKETLETVIHHYGSVARLEIERRTDLLWKRLLPNVQHYDVLITEDFELTVVSPVGTEGMAQLAMGQQQCLGLAFITAVAYVSETKPPLVIDMPFARLDGEVAARVASTLPELTSQLVLFVLLKSTEWSEEVQQALAPHLARVVTLTYDEATSTTTATAQDR